MTPFARGDKVRLNDGVFRYFTGVVADVDAKRRMLAVSITVFDRAFVIGLGFAEVKKVA